MAWSNHPNKIPDDSTYQSRLEPGLIADLEKLCDKYHDKIHNIAEAHFPDPQTAVTPPTAAHCIGSSACRDVNPVDEFCEKRLGEYEQSIIDQAYEYIGIKMLENGDEAT